MINYRKEIDAPRAMTKGCFLIAVTLGKVRDSRNNG